MAQCFICSLGPLEQNLGTVILPARAMSLHLLMALPRACCDWCIFSFFFKQLMVAPVTLGGKVGQVFGVLMMISLSKPAQAINGFEMLIRRRA